MAADGPPSDNVPPIESMESVITRTVWNAPRPAEDPIQMDNERAQQVGIIENYYTSLYYYALFVTWVAAEFKEGFLYKMIDWFQVMSAMANFALPQASIPDWAQSITEDQWKQTLNDRIEKIKSNS